jgi:hypothetical protein
MMQTRNEKIQLVERLDQEGGFAKALGQALLLADPENEELLLITFPHILKKKVKLKLIK